mmetsp:Transcript_20660/g.52705  ORF Transcript_20660/g.52705 Transcript_20660/m.52705 type:complete len:621 (-) Transcript_20660:377-2239(-)
MADGTDGRGESRRFGHKLLLVPSQPLHGVVVAEHCLVGLACALRARRHPQRVRSGRHAWEGGHVDALDRQVLDRAPEEKLFEVVQQQDAAAGLSGTPRTTEAVDVLVAVGGDAHLDDGRHVGVVQAAGRDVRGENDAAARFSERVSALRPVRLALARVNFEHLALRLGELLREEAREAGGREEDHDLVSLRAALHLEVDGGPQILGHALHVRDAHGLVDLVGRDLLVRPHGVDHLVVALQRQLRDLLDLRRERGGEERALPLRRRWHRLQDLQDRVAEAHVQQLVRLVQTDHGKILEARLEALGVVQVVLQATGRRHEDVDRPARELAVVALDVGAAEEACGAQLRVVFEQELGLFGDLGGELARGREHDGPNGATDAAGAAADQLNDGHEEGERLACAGPRAGQDVLLGQHRPDGGGLHHGHELVTEALCERPLGLGGDRQLAKLLVGEVRCGHRTGASGPLLVLGLLLGRRLPHGLVSAGLLRLAALAVLASLATALIPVLAALALLAALAAGLAALVALVPAALGALLAAAALVAGEAAAAAASPGVAAVVVVIAVLAALGGATAVVVVAALGTASAIVVVVAALGHASAVVVEAALAAASAAVLEAALRAALGVTP